MLSFQTSIANSYMQPSVFRFGKYIMTPNEKQMLLSNPYKLSNFMRMHIGLKICHFFVHVTITEGPKNVRHSNKMHCRIGSVFVDVEVRKKIHAQAHTHMIF